MTQSLIAWHHHNRVGELSLNEGRWSFVYDTDWINRKESFELSPWFPKNSQAIIDSADDKRVEWFFENLLPEGGMREALALKAKLSAKDYFGLLTHYGRESAGALTLLPDKQQYTNNDHYSLLNYTELNGLILQSKGQSLLTSNRQLHMSLAGVQNKLGIYYIDDQFALPLDSSPSTHILKPDNDNTQFPYCPANEFFCMQLAKSLGYPVPETFLMHLPEPIYLVKRYDRRIVKEDNSVERLHQIDLCQFLNKWSGYKYESHGGITLTDIFSDIHKLTQPAVSRQSIVQWIIFNYLIGNNDAHAKNLSLIITPKAIQIAPWYDLLCVETYLSESVMAMTINDQIKPGMLHSEDWSALAALSGIPARLMNEYIEAQAKNIEGHALKIVDYPDFRNDEREFIVKSVLPVIQQRLEFLKAR